MLYSIIQLKRKWYNTLDLILIFLLVQRVIAILILYFVNTGKCFNWCIALQPPVQYQHAKTNLHVDIPEAVSAAIS